MLSMSDADINLFLPIFAQTGVPVAFLVPTPTGFGKAIMDATGPVRTLLYNEHIHDYQTFRAPTSPTKQINCIRHFFILQCKIESIIPGTRKNVPGFKYDLVYYLSLLPSVYFPKTAHPILTNDPLRINQPKFTSSMLVYIFSANVTIICVTKIMTFAIFILYP